jgi:hypothetical protein
MACVVYSELTDRGPLRRAAPTGSRPCRGGPHDPVGPCDTSAVVLYFFLYVVVRFMLETLIVRSRSEARLRAEVLALRHQLAVLERQVGRPRWQPTDRLVLAALSRVLPRPDWRSLLPRPETLLRWHRELVRRRWAAYRRRPRRQRPVVRSELHDLILKLARENEGWGYRRIVGELRKLDHRCSNLTVRKVLRRHGQEPAPRRSQRTWREFGRRAGGRTRSTIADCGAGRAASDDGEAPCARSGRSSDGPPCEAHPGFACTPNLGSPPPTSRSDHESRSSSRLAAGAVVARTRPTYAGPAPDASAAESRDWAAMIARPAWAAPG